MVKHTPLRIEIYWIIPTPTPNTDKFSGVPCQFLSFALGQYWSEEKKPYYVYNNLRKTGLREMLFLRNLYINHRLISDIFLKRKAAIIPWKLTMLTGLVIILALQLDQLFKYFFWERQHTISKLTNEPIVKRVPST